jgi:hypothetical protein
MNKIPQVVGAAIGVALVTTVIVAWPIQWLWNNALVGAVDGINPIGFWQALGITFLCNVLFKNSTNTNSK